MTARCPNCKVVQKLVTHDHHGYPRNPDLFWCKACRSWQPILNK